MFKTIELNWDVNHASTHPPTAFLLTAPIAHLPYPLTLSIWMIVMLTSIPISILLFGFSVRWAAISVLLALLWPPAFTSLGQLTPIWLFGTALGFHFRNNKIFLSGVGIALASLTKYFPALLILISIKEKKWKALLGFLFIWLMSILILITLNYKVIFQYIDANLVASPNMVERLDNGSLFASMSQTIGPFLGIFLSLLFIFLVSLSVDHSNKNLWLLGCWVAVALLPISWCYSLLPLLPIILFTIKRKKPLPILLGLLSLLLSIPYQFGEVAARIDAIVIVIVGICLLFIKEN